MARASEILFIDPSVPYLETVLGNLRPEVRGVVLHNDSLPARQIAEALEGLEGLNAVHIIAHGAPGCVAFSAGEWSTPTLERDAGHLSTIGCALAQHGELRIWSCNTGAGLVGKAFVRGLEDTTGANVAAAAARI